MKTNITNIKRIVAKVRSMYKYDRKTLATYQDRDEFLSL